MWLSIVRSKDDRLIAPDLLQQEFAAEDAARIAGEQGEQREFGRGQGDARLAAGHLVRGDVDLQVRKSSRSTPVAGRDCSRIWSIRRRMAPILASSSRIENGLVR